MTPIPESDGGIETTSMIAKPRTTAAMEIRPSCTVLDCQVLFCELELSIIRSDRRR